MRYLSFVPLLLLALHISLPRLTVADSHKKVGAILVLSSDWGEWGKNCQRALELAYKDRSDIKLITESSEEAKPRNALSALHKLIDIDKVSLVIGPMSPEEFAAVAPVAEKRQIPVISFVASGAYSAGAILVWMDPEFEAKVIAQHLRNRFKSVAILSSDMEWESRVARAFAEEFRASGGKVVALEEPATSTQDVSSQILRVKKGKPEAVFISSYLLFSHYQKELEQQRVFVPRYGIEIDQSAIDLAGSSADGTIFISPSLGSDDFRDAFLNRFGSPANIPAAQCFDAAKISLDFLDSEDTTYSDFKRFARSLTGFSGVSGNLRFSHPGVSGDTIYWQIFNGKAKEVGRSYVDGLQIFRDEFDTTVTVRSERLFESDNKTLSKSGQFLLSNISEIIKQELGERIIVSAHYDSKLSESENLEISASSADAISMYLTGKKIPDSKIQTQPLGARYRISEPRTTDNNRIEFVIQRVLRPETAFRSKVNEVVGAAKDTAQRAGEVVSDGAKIGYEKAKSGASSALDGLSNVLKSLSDKMSESDRAQ